MFEPQVMNFLRGLPTALSFGPSLLDKDPANPEDLLLKDASTFFITPGQIAAYGEGTDAGFDDADSGEPDYEDELEQLENLAEDNGISGKYGQTLIYQRGKSCEDFDRVYLTIEFSAFSGELRILIGDGREPRKAVVVWNDKIGKLGS